MKKLSQQTLVAVVGSEQDAQRPELVTALVTLIANSVLPDLIRYFPWADRQWAADTQSVAAEYAKQLAGCGFNGRVVMEALELAKQQSTTRRNVPNPMEFKLLCAQCAGYPSAEQALDEITTRANAFGKKPEWSSPFVYWLSAHVGYARKTQPAHRFNPFFEEQYVKLLQQALTTGLKPIPKQLENKAKPPVPQVENPSFSTRALMDRINRIPRNKNGATEVAP